MNHPNRYKLAVLKALAKNAGMTFHRDPYGSYGKREWVLETGKDRRFCGMDINSIDPVSFEHEILRASRA